jgi:hypothetical protein
LVLLIIPQTEQCHNYSPGIHIASGTRSNFVMI